MQVSGGKEMSNHAAMLLTRDNKEKTSAETWACHLVFFHYVCKDRI